MCVWGVEGKGEGCVCVGWRGRERDVYVCVGWRGRERDVGSTQTNLLL